MGERGRLSAMIPSGHESLYSRPRVLVADDRVLGEVLHEVAARLALRGAEIIRLPLELATKSNPLTDEQIEHYFAGSDIAVISTRTVVDRVVFENSPRLRAVVFASAGVNSCDIDAATDACVLVSNGATGANIESMAESQILAILSLLYQLDGKREAFERGDVISHPQLRAASRMLTGRSLGFIGYGRLTKAVITRLIPWRLGRIVVHTRTFPERPELESGSPHFTSLDDVIESVDILCVNVPLSSSTAGLLSRERLRKMQRDAFLIVQSRGGIVDESAVADMLAQGKLGGAAFDTFAQEPLSLQHPLRATSATLTDHNIGHTREMFASFADHAVEAVTALANARLPIDIVNTAVTPRWLTTWKQLTLIKETN